MIHMVMARANLELGIELWLKTRGVAIQSIVTPHAYEDLFVRDTVPTGTWIFSGLCTLTSVGRSLASELRTQLVNAGCRVLNDPQRSLRRLDLLNTMHAAGINQFRAVRAGEYRGGLRFPVFIRRESRHDGSVSPLLHSEAEVRREVFSLRLRGQSLDDLLIVELRDLSIDGVFRKYSAFRVGDRIIARYAQSSSHWMVKADAGNRTAESAEEEIRYAEENPHAELVAPLFEMAKIEYGRMDYGYRDGRVEVWEINTAPTLGRNPHIKPRPGTELYRSMMQETHAAVHARVCRAMEEVDSPPSSVIIPTEFDRSALAAWRREEANRGRRESMVRRLHAVAAIPGVRVAWRSIESAGRRLLGA